MSRARFTSEIPDQRVEKGATSMVALETLEEILTYARSHDYAGYDYSDGMSAPIRRYLPVDNRWLNLAIQETIKRSPVNIRPLLLVPRRRSFKGCALFASAHIGMYELTNDESELRQAKSLIDWLLDNHSSDPFGWGHNHDIQWPEGKVPRNTPNIISNTYVLRSIIEYTRHDAFAASKRVGERTVECILDELLVDEALTRIKYDPLASTDAFVINANALGGALLVELSDWVDDGELRQLGESILDYVASRQHHTGGWSYMDPAEASHLSMDNHHNGFIIESFLRYQSATGSKRYQDTLKRSLDFYKSELFESDGAPNWDESNDFPRDIHAAAQGIITFSLAGDIHFAETILSWTREHLFNGSNAFYFRKGRFMTNRTILMRWCQAWMAYALAQYCLCASGIGDFTE